MAWMQETWTDERMDTVVGNLLRVGVTAAAVVVIIGGMMFLISNGSALPQYHSFRGEPLYLRNVRPLIKDATSLDGRGVIQFGFLLLIATPVLRVAICVFAFARQHDRLYVIVTLIVLAVLFYSLARGQS